MGRNTLSNEYFDWLYKKATRKTKLSYVKLCKELHSKKFRWFVHNDDNRCEDGRALRDRFCELKQLDESHLEVRHFLKADCTVFEIMVALAQRMNDITYDLNDTANNKTHIFFMAMIENLGLTRFVDSYGYGNGRFDPITEAHIDEILEVFLDRAYKPDGQGGLFPLKQKRHREDQSRVEIWYQMQNWLEENY